MKTSDKNAPAPTEQGVSSKGDRTVRVSSLAVDSKLKEDIFDKRGILLLAQGATVTKRFLSQLKRYHITTVTTKSSTEKSMPPAPTNTPTTYTTEHVETATTLSLDTMISSLSFHGVIPASRSKPTTRLKLNLMRKEIRIGLKNVDETARYYETQVGKVSRREETDLRPLGSFVQKFSDLAIKDGSLGPMIANFQSESYQHESKQVAKTAVLTVAIANYLEVNPVLVNEIGVAALVQDLGMMCVPESIRLAKRKLSHDEMLQIKHHPIYSLDILEKAPSISKLVQAIVYQAHERSDGSGYPRGRTGRLIHPLAKLLAVADTYSAMTTDKPHRKAMSSYAAVKDILQEAYKGRLDRDMVRNFLDFLSVFPVGSRVQLSDGSTAKVLRSNGSLHTKPVVLRLNEDMTESDTELDLSQADQIQITRYLS